MTQRAVVVGGGVGGIVAANHLARRGQRLEVVVLDGHDDHICQPLLPHVPLGLRRPDELRRALRPLLHPRVRLDMRRGIGIDTAARTVALEGGGALGFDALVLATGVRVAPERIPGFREAAYHFHCVNRAATLAEQLAAFPGGDLVVGGTHLPSKCPLAPLEMAFLLDEHLAQGGRRSRTRIHCVSPYARASSLAPVADLAERLFEARGIQAHCSFAAAAVEPERRELRAASGEVIGFDLLILVPPQKTAPLLRDSGLTGENDFVPTDARTLRVAPCVYAVGDNADLPAPKLGSAAVLQARVAARNAACELAGLPQRAAYDGSSAFLMETGRGRAVLVRTSYAGPVRQSGPGRKQRALKRLLDRFYFWRLARL